MILGKRLVVTSVLVDTTILGKLFRARLPLVVDMALGNLLVEIFPIRSSNI